MRRFARLLLIAVALAAIWPCDLRAQAGVGSGRSQSDPATVLAAALTAACRQDVSAFAPYLTTENMAAFRKLPDSQRIAVLQRFVLLDDPGKPLLSTNAEGHTELRCEAAGVVSEMRFGATQLRDNLAFIAVEVPQAGVPGESTETQSVRFGLVREDGSWKLLSLGLLLLDIPTLQERWAAAEVEGRESTAIAALHSIAEALNAYREAYGQLPESLVQLGPPPVDGASPEKAGLLEAQLASGDNMDYKFRYNIVPSTSADDSSDREKVSGFELAATPDEYGKSGRRSFYLGSSGILRAADKHGAVATVDDPRIAEPQPPNQP